MLKGTILIGNHNLSDRRTVRITPTPLDEVFYLYNIFICMENKKYIDKVLEHLVKNTKIDYGDQNLNLPFIPSTNYPFFLSLPFSLFFSSFKPSLTILFPISSFSKYCKDTFGLTKKEMDYVIKQYKDIMLEKIHDGW